VGTPEHHTHILGQLIGSFIGLSPELINSILSFLLSLHLPIRHLHYLKNFSYGI
jgi:hypothetical protein